MTEDLLTNVRQQLEERIEQLRGAVEERDRLQANLRALEAEPWVLDAGLTGPMSMDIEPEALEARREVLDARPEALDAESQALNAGPGALDAGPAPVGVGPAPVAVSPGQGVMHAGPEALNAEPAPVEVEPVPVALEVGPPAPVIPDRVVMHAGPVAVRPDQGVLDFGPEILGAHPEMQEMVEVDPGALEADPGPPANVVRFPARPAANSASESAPAPASEPAPAPARAPAVSPKVARLMLAPRRPALERSGIARVSGRADASRRSSSVDENESQAQIRQHAI
jgi:hypothetical protein